MTDKLILKSTAPVAELILNHPERRNALNLAMWTAIPGLLDQAVATDGVRAIIIHGGEAGHFAAGADITEFAPSYASREGSAAAANQLADATRAIETCPVPVIAAIEGSCMGAGLALATAADLRVIADGTKICLPPAKLGAAYPYSDLRRLALIAGLAAARDLLLTARTIDADEAAAIGLASRRVVKGGALAEARAIGEGMATLSGWALNAGKIMLNRISASDHGEPEDMRALQLEGFQSADFLEGQSAFLEKRKPQFN